MRVDNSSKTLKRLKKEIFDDDEKLNIGNERRKDDGTISDLKKYYADKIEGLEEELSKNISENDLKKMQTDFFGKCKYSDMDLAYP